MYQFSLDAYINLFTWSIEHSPRAQGIEQRIEALNEFHTFAVYRLVKFMVKCSAKLQVVPYTRINYVSSFLLN